MAAPRGNVGYTRDLIPVFTSGSALNSNFMQRTGTSRQSLRAVVDKAKHSHAIICLSDLSTLEMVGGHGRCHQQSPRFPALTALDTEHRGPETRMTTQPSSVLGQGSPQGRICCQQREVVFQVISEACLFRLTPPLRLTSARSSASATTAFPFSGDRPACAYSPLHWLSQLRKSCPAIRSFEILGARFGPG